MWVLHAVGNCGVMDPVGSELATDPQLAAATWCAGTGCNGQQSGQMAAQCMVTAQCMVCCQQASVAVCAVCWLGQLACFTAVMPAMLACNRSKSAWGIVIALGSTTCEEVVWPDYLPKGCS